MDVQENRLTASLLKYKCWRLGGEPSRCCCCLRMLSGKRSFQRHAEHELQVRVFVASPKKESHEGFARSGLNDVAGGDSAADGLRPETRSLLAIQHNQSDNLDEPRPKNEICWREGLYQMPCQGSRGLARLHHDLAMEEANASDGARRFR